MGLGTARAHHRGFPTEERQVPRSLIQDRQDLRAQPRTRLGDLDPNLTDCGLHRIMEREQLQARDPATPL